MRKDQIPEDLRHFILDALPSVPHLEALLLLRAQQGIPSSADAIAKRLYVAEKTAEGVLRDLVATRLVAREDRSYRYAPASLELARLVDRLAEFYAHALVAVTNLIHERAARIFADAFKFRKP